jgi:phosphoglycerate dehydrogenase-like enzyme
MQRVVVAVGGLSEPQRRRIQAALESQGEVRFIGEKQPDWSAALDGATIVFGWPEPKALFQSGVLFHQLPSSGYEGYLAASNELRRTFAMANARGVCAGAVAEHCLSMMFAFVRKIPKHLRQQMEHRWQRAERYDLIAGATLCVVGLGAIGRVLAGKGRALGMHVLAVTRTGEPAPGVERTFVLADLHRALAFADHVAIALPLLASDEPLFGRTAFEHMKPGSYLYSLGRGSHVDYDALRDALHTGHVAGAGLDVFAEEPLSPDDPLWDEAHVLISPHAAGRFAGEIDDLISLFLTNTLLFLRGKPVHNLVLGSATSFFA